MKTKPNRISKKVMWRFEISKIYIITLLIICTISPVFATGYCVVNKLDKIFKPSMTEKANAVCYFYKNGMYKCACKEPVNLKIWTSGDVSKFKGFSTHRVYGNIKDCSVQPTQETAEIIEPLSD